MTRAAQSADSSPIAPVPGVAEPICDEFVVRISTGAESSSDLERDLGGQWVGRLRSICAAKLSTWGLTPLVDDAKLLLSELVTNALRYGEGGEIEFRLVITPRGLLIAVDDGSAVRPQLSDVGTAGETGRGLLLVAALAGDWGVSPDGTTTWCTLHLPEAWNSEPPRRQPPGWARLRLQPGTPSTHK
jgi:anti-sigma regulatory factor (Ser/Thr protein kinase)